MCVVAIRQGPLDFPANASTWNKPNRLDAKEAVAAISEDRHKSFEYRSPRHSGTPPSTSAATVTIVVRCDEPMPI
jgi:hypothetical protein